MNLKRITARALVSIQSVLRLTVTMPSLLTLRTGHHVLGSVMGRESMTTVSGTPDLDCDSLPFWSVSFAGSGKSVGNLVEDVIPDVVIGCDYGELPAHRDTLLPIFATTESADGIVKLESPAVSVKSFADQKTFGHLSNLVKSQSSLRLEGFGVIIVIE